MSVSEVTIQRHVGWQELYMCYVSCDHSHVKPECAVEKNEANCFLLNVSQPQSLIICKLTFSQVVSILT